MEQQCLIHETIKIKSGAWDDIGIFVYSTLNHIKYALPNGDNGIIRTLENPVYLVRVKGKNIVCLDREGKTRVLTIDPTEYRFKLALIRKNYEEVMQIIRTSNLVGQSIIAYLQKKGYSEIAMHFVKDPKTRFELALECGNIDVATECAKSIDHEEVWHKLGEEALRQGNQLVLEMCYQRAKNFDKLAFLYLITGNVEKLKKMLKIAEMRGDNMSRYTTSLYLGDVQEQVKMLREVGQLPLAYLTAKTHGLDAEAQAIAEQAGKNPDELDLQFDHQAILLKPPTPLYKQFDNNWPQLMVTKGMFDGGLFPQEDNRLAAASTLDDQTMEDATGWGEDLDLDLDGTGSKPKPLVTSVSALSKPQETEEGGWDMDDDLDIPDDLSPTDEDAPVATKGVFAAPTQGTSINDIWVRNSTLAVDHVAAGSFDSAMQMLNRQVGAVNFAPLKPLFMTIYSSAHSYISGFPAVGPLSFNIHRTQEGDPRKFLPALAIDLHKLIDRLQEAYGATTAGRFADAVTLFRTILHSVLFVVATKKSELDEIDQLIAMCREYIVGLRMEMSRKELGPDDAKRATELAAYFTHCQIQPTHLQLSLRSAMTLAYKLKNMQSASLFARRLLETAPSAQVSQQAKKLLQVAEKNPTDEVKLDYDQYNPFVICGKTFVPIYRGNPTTTCPFCGTWFKPEFKGHLCPTCDISTIGASASGLRNQSEK